VADVMLAGFIQEGEAALVALEEAPEIFGGDGAEEKHAD
jgi:hypothetical protein